MSNYLSFVTQNRGDSFKGKNRIFFTCHKDDFAHYFHRLCDDIFKISDAAIFYTEDMDYPLSIEERQIDLMSMELFLIPVTKKLLESNVRAIKEDLSFAINNHISVLPILLESGLDEEYRKVFGNIQYLKRASSDETERAYSLKLEEYLTKFLIKDSLLERIDQVFKYSVFISYRKKDRAKAQKLMELIHKNNNNLDIGFWYDEFLVPGEDFNEGIASELKNADAFLLLVTDNLTKENNYVETIEYPMAKQLHKKIIPIRYGELDEEELHKRYKDLPNILDKDCSDIFNKLIKNGDSEFTDAQKYLLGVAYLKGIKTEINRERGIELLEEAANNGDIEAVYT